MVVNPETFLMPVSGIKEISSDTLLVLGKAMRGSIKADTEVEIIGLRTHVKVNVLQVDHSETENAYQILITGFGDNEVYRGMVVADVSSIQTFTQFEGKVYVLTKAESGSTKILFTGFRPQFYIHNMDIAGEISLLGKKDLIMPGESAYVSIVIQWPVALEIGMEFSFRVGSRTVATGSLTKVIK